MKGILNHQLASGGDNQRTVIPDEAFTITVFNQDVMRNAHVMARYGDEFDEAR